MEKQIRSFPFAYILLHWKLRSLERWHAERKVKEKLTGNEEDEHKLLLEEVILM